MNETGNSTKEIVFKLLMNYVKMVIFDTFGMPKVSKMIILSLFLPPIGNLS